MFLQMFILHPTLLCACAVMYFMKINSDKHSLGLNCQNVWGWVFKHVHLIDHVILFISSQGHVLLIILFKKLLIFSTDVV